MESKELTPIREDASDFDALESLIIQLLRENIYLPLIAEFKLSKSKLVNSLDDIVKAILSGRITFYRGVFRGRFSSTLSGELRKIGAEWDRKQGSFTIPISKLPNSIRTAISMSESNYQAKVQKIMKKLSDIVPEQFAEKLQSTPIFDAVLWKTEKKFQDSIKNITVEPIITPEMRDRISEEYTKNMQLYIKEFSEKEIENLRDQIEKNAMSGGRSESLVKEIQKSYGVSQRKAKFLARQETSLMMTKYKQTRYQSAGINEYRWQCVNNSKDSSPYIHTEGNVRYYHAINNGKKFNWNEGAIVNHNGDKKNPGQDYNCRCIAIPIVRFY